MVFFINPFFCFSTSYGKGIHWFFLGQREIGHYELFDSLGNDVESVKKLLAQFAGKCDFNENVFQAKESTSCGEFCVYFAIQRYFNEDLDLQQVLEECFDKNLQRNEERIQQFLSSF